MASESRPSAPVQPRLELSYRIRFDECGADGRLPASGFLRYAQDVAWAHSEAAGFDRAWYRERGLTWLIRALELDVIDHAPYGDELTVSTEVLGIRRSWARRRSEFQRGGTERPVAVAAIDWLLLGERGAPVRIPADILDVFETPPGTFTPLRIYLPPTSTEADRAKFEVRRSELDPLGHVNNAAYLDYIDQQLADAGHEPALRRLPRRYRVEFVASAEAGMALYGAVWADRLAWCYRLDSDDGRELVRARIESEGATWVGG